MRRLSAPIWEGDDVGVVVGGPEGVGGIAVGDGLDGEPGSALRAGGGADVGRRWWLRLWEVTGTSMSADERTYPLEGAQVGDARAGVRRRARARRSRVFCQARSTTAISARSGDGPPSAVRARGLVQQAVSSSASRSTRSAPGYPGPCLPADHPSHTGATAARTVSYAHLSPAGWAISQPTIWSWRSGLEVRATAAIWAELARPTPASGCAPSIGGRIAVGPGTVTEDGDMVDDGGTEAETWAHGHHDPPLAWTATSTATVIPGPIQKKYELDLPSHQCSSRPQLEQELDLKLDLQSPGSAGPHVASTGVGVGHIRAVPFRPSHARGGGRGRDPRCADRSSGASEPSVSRAERTRTERAGPDHPNVNTVPVAAHEIQTVPARPDGPQRTATSPSRPDRSLRAPPPGLGFGRRPTRRERSDRRGGSNYVRPQQSEWSRQRPDIGDGRQAFDPGCTPTPVALVSPRAHTGQEQHVARGPAPPHQRCKCVEPCLALAARGTTVAPADAAVARAAGLSRG